MLSAAAGLLLSGCILFDDSQRAGPDEFGVVSRAPLSQPPDYTLRPPRAGAKRPNETTPREQARQTLLGQSSPAAGTAPTTGVPTLNAPGVDVPAGMPKLTVPSTGGIAVADAAPAGQVDRGVSPGELELLRLAGAQKVDPNIRTLVDRESGRVKEERSLVDRLVFWRSGKSPGKVVDAKREAERLNREAALGQSPAGTRQRSGDR